MKNPIKLVCAAMAATFALASAQATTYYWKGGAESSSFSDFATATNWSTVGLDGEAATSYPSSADELYNDQNIAMDMGGGSYEIGVWNPYSAGYNHPYLYIRNGTLKFCGDVKTHDATVTLSGGGNLVFDSTCTFIAGAWVDGGFVHTIGDGCSSTLNCSLKFYAYNPTVSSGGTLTLAPKTFDYYSSEKASFVLESYGLTKIPNGLTLAHANANTTVAFNLYSGGEIALGGPLDMLNDDGTCSFTIAGGTISATGTVSFAHFDTLQATGSFVANVEQNGRLDLSGYTFGQDVSITKTGAGSVVLPTSTLTATISGGSVILNAMTYDFSDVTFGAGTTINLASLGGRIDSADSSIANATFSATIPATAGTAVFYSTDATLLAKVKADLDASTPAGFDLVISGQTLSVEAETAASFTATGDITAAAGWGGAVPAAGSDVAIDGADVVATLPSSGVLPAWNSIEVKNGATLRIEADATLPAIILNKNATLEIGGNATVTMSDLTGAVATSPSLVVPSLAVESGATLSVPGGMKFSNVDIDLKGTIAVTTEGGIGFGYAAAGDTTYIGLAVDGGTISLTAGSGSYDASPLEFCCPESGGTVVAVGDLTLTDASILPVYVSSSVTYTFTESHKYGFHLGVNNPTNELFEVVFDGTKWGVCGKTIIKGGATFRLVNGGTYKEYETHTLWNRTCEISEMGRVVVGTGCEFRLPAMGDYGNKALEIKPGYARHQAVVVEDGGIFETYRSSGNGKGVLAVSNGVYQVYLPWTTNASFAVEAYNIPFEGLASVEVANESTLTFSTRNRVFWNPGQFHNDSGDRVVALADVPIKGGGSIALDNANANVFGVVVKSGANEATGTASVVPPTEGEGATTLYFANGANWAGTVVAGNVALTNLVDAAAASTNSFTTLDLADGTVFPIRVWKTGGVIVSHDVLNVGEYLNHGGKIELVEMGEELARGDVIILGTIGTESLAPTCSPKWNAEIIDGAGKEKLLRMRYQSGLSIIFR